MTDEAESDRPKGGRSQAEILREALRRKTEAEPEPGAPEHRTSVDGGVSGGQVGATDTRVGKEGTWTENTGRSHGARVGDAGKTTGPGRKPAT